MSLILMIFTSVFGFTNLPKAFYLMGYAAIPWYILGGICFFIPYAFMLTEFGAAYKEEKGGIYLWMSRAIGPKYAFVGTFMWYTSYVVWMVNVANGIWIPLSNGIFGTDRTQTLSLLGLNDVQSLGIIAIFWIIFITFVSSRGLDKVKKVTSVAGSAVALINILLILGSVLVVALNGQMAEPVTTASFVTSPNEEYHNIVSVFSFLVFAIFAYGGLEVVAGLVNETENAEKTFPRAILTSAVVVTAGYIIGIFCMGSFSNWNFAFTQFGNVKVTLGNVSYLVMNNMGYQLGHALSLSEAASVQMGLWVSRYMGLSMFLALTGAFFAIIVSALKQLMEGTPKGLFPEKYEAVRDGIPYKAMNIQAVVVCVIIALVSFGGSDAKAFWVILINMTNVAMTLPCMFICIAYWKFKNNDAIVKPIAMFKSKTTAFIATCACTFTVGFANFFTIIQPAMNGRLLDSVYSIVGPILFGVIAYVIYRRYEKRVAKGEIVTSSDEEGTGTVKV